VTKTVKTFLATYRPAGGRIRGVLVQEEHGWVAFFGTDPEASVEDILEAAPDRGAIEQTNKDVKEVWGAAQQQVRNLHSNISAFNLNCQRYSLVAAWAWEQSEEDLVDRSQGPWDEAYRRPSHADKRKALQPQGVAASGAARGSPSGPGRTSDQAGFSRAGGKAATRRMTVIRSRKVQLEQRYPAVRHRLQQLAGQLLAATLIADNETILRHC